MYAVEYVGSAGSVRRDSVTRALMGSLSPNSYANKPKMAAAVVIRIQDGGAYEP